MTNESGFVSKQREVLAAGEYDAVIHGIVNVGLREGRTFTETDEFGNKIAKKQEPAIQWKVIFELPNVIRSDGTTAVIHKNIKLSDFIPKKPGQPESAFYKLLKAVGETPTQLNVQSYMVREGAAKLAGKAVSLTVINYENDFGVQSKVAGFSRLDPRLPQPIATREFFYFAPLAADIDVFKNTLTYWTQKEIMEALNADLFSKELHAAWRDVEEERASKTTEVPWNNTTEENRTAILE